MSHSSPSFVARPLADEFFVESKSPPGGYAQWALETARRLGIDVFWPSRGARELSAMAGEFEAAGTRLMSCAPPWSLDILEDKALFYRHLEGSGLGIPRFRTVGSLGDLKAAAEELGSAGAKMCLKPRRSLFGLGFKIISPSADPLAAFLQSDAVKITLADALRVLDVPQERFPALLAMELLEGIEHSVDCLARDGRLLKCAIRVKSKEAGAPERIADDPAIEAVARKLAKIFSLSHIFNLQLIRTSDGDKLLEINPRMAGGLYFSCLAGVNYPYLALKAALAPPGAPDPPIPFQRSDLLVSQHWRPFVYEARKMPPREAPKEPPREALGAASAPSGGRP